MTDRDGSRSASTRAGSPIGWSRRSSTASSPTPTGPSSRPGPCSSSPPPTRRAARTARTRAGGPASSAWWRSGDAGVSQLRRQRHVQEPRQSPRQPAGRPALHRLREPEAPPGERAGHGGRGRSAPRGARRRPARRARARRGDLSELPALYPHDDDGRDVGVCPVRGPHAARARVESSGRCSARSCRPSDPASEGDGHA